MNKKKEQPENEKPPEEEAPAGGTSEELTGPKLTIQYANNEKKTMFMQADESFGPFIVITFEDFGHAGFMMQSVAVSPEMWAAALTRLRIQTEMRMTEAIIMHRQREGMGRIAVPPGTKLKPGPQFKV